MKIIPIQATANEDAATCSKCGGECCKGMPGIFHPDDLFENMSDLEIKNKILSMLHTGDVVITDNEIADEKSNYSIRVESLAPRATRRNQNWYQSFNYGQCTNLTDSGCRLTAIDRPRECRALVPAERPNKCKPESSFNRNDLLNEWTIYEEIMQQVADYHAEHIAIRL